ncbi:xanthine dehydrogenase family protein molybdopterin-binding subunit [Actibacterium sp. 188UL27-1]|uniref:xanthine dehydrogenase family protein molybdopterin-binding subunit n=1 Tax=Actibacterium sp. 188UL27-1 TaxID=2786961 RepID=UPI00195A9C44|nr:xanthine dehydrogenase family protein molybdopterin-binding subunit [Actibacterium sp. 188UL27-1]MBM7066143.1 xanthine dehydrogenase family protein molybdopterin-binding subunit [Actibacterium sp. 188UL27-1]
MIAYLSNVLDAPRPSRRGFLKLSAGAVGGLLIGGMAPRSVAAADEDGSFAMPFVHITPENVVTVVSKHLDKGQGTATGLATLVAEELDADPAQITVEFAPADAEVYANTMFGLQGTGGSTAMANSFQQYREAGAAARAMLIAAAAEAWGVPPGEITVAAGTLSAGGNSATFGEMAKAAAGLAVPAEVTLKTPDQWVLIGKDMPRVDVPAKSAGAVGMYGMDVQPEGGLVAVTARCPCYGGVVASFDDAAARQMRGVVDVLQIPQGVVVIADNTWRAIQARDALEIEWDMAEAEARGTDALMEEYTALLDQPGNTAIDRGDSEANLANATAVVEADYAFPYLAHATMEPLNITVLYDGETAEFWTGSQIQTLDHNVGAAVLELDPSKVQIHTKWGGGSFGRRATADSHLVAEAAMIGSAYLASQGEARPIKLVYTREDDLHGRYYRPLHLHRVKAGVDAEGRITGWQHRVVGQGIMIGTAFESFTVKDGVDHSSVEGASDTTYDLPHLVLDTHHPSVGTPVLWWRAVGHTHTAYVMETMMDELAEAAGQDPVAFRLAHLKNDPRLAGVLTLAAEKAGWDQPAAEGIHRGVAVHKSFNSYVAEVAEVRMRDDGTVKVERVVCGVDCGVAINPDNIKAQIEGGLGYGLSGILREEITLTGGEVDQFNYPDYTPLRITDMPEVEVHIVASAEAPTGIGEPGTPPIGPAVANAVAKATGQRIRSLPFTKHGLA